ncbi:cAMP-binding domain of CRP or a regulatory subunit of cAMP-dependent protein kinases [Geodermatophilus sabuli]|uniref:cAMP-binding domain of CRP or a regulatory subunit of cAMP-dependent protein kinases n=1 Tax=Geodermatophilus sabuli TaxID=1564158 RepID=A0A285EI44_9ACTN|nr:cAMP-binding domain of CRP or a regulatory subunit of cAMP-dependent protein kinases [Geodermatophilus sabuli]
MSPRGPDPAVVDAWENSYLAELSEQVRDLVLADSFVLTIPPGNVIYEAYGQPRLALILSGHAKVQVLSQGGRAATIRYAGPGQVIGLPAVISDGAPYGARAIGACQVAMLNVSVLRRLANTDVSVAWLFARKVTEGSYESIELLGISLFGTVRQRVSRHLLDLAERKDNQLVVQVNQQELADAIGSVREVVARALRQLQDDELVARTPGALVLLDPAALHAVASGGD